MLFIGIDEAGYGPLIGPLCHGSAAFRIDNHSIPHPPNLWELLHPAVSRDGSSGIAISDSKALYSTKGGIGALLMGVRACMNCTREERISMMQLSMLVPSADCSDIETDRWSAEHHPCDDGEIAECPCESLKIALKKAGVFLAAVTARAMSARNFNAAMTGGANKADVNWRVAAAELKRLSDLALPGESIFAAIDRQGGRKFYAAQLCDIFQCALVRVEREDEKASVYCLEKDGRNIRVGFYVDGDSLHLPIALASMCAKLARELIMQRINAYFKRHEPTLTATAGYYNDAQRFLDDTRALRRKLKIQDSHFIRAR